MPEPKRPLKVFLCHASTDKPKVRELYRYLKRRGINPWFDEEHLVGGQDWQVEIPKALATSDAILICLTKNSVDKEGYIQKEIKFALDKALEMPEGRIFLIPVKFEECEVPFSLSRYQWVDLTIESGYAKMMKALKFRASQLERSTIEFTKKDVLEENIAREKAEKEAVEKARLEATELARQKTAKEKAEREATELAEKERKEKELREKQAREAREKEKRESEKKEEKPARVKPKIGGQIANWFGGFIVLVVGIIFLSSLSNTPSIPQPTPENIQTQTIAALPQDTTKPNATVTPEPTSNPTSTMTPAPNWEPTSLSAEITDAKGVTMVLVPEGEFVMGSDSGNFDEMPVHNVYLSAYLIDVNEVSAVDYEKCVLSGVCNLPKEYDGYFYYQTPFGPIVNITWYDAVEFCNWRDARLPTEAEWEKAARGTDQRIYPWGDELGEVGELVGRNDYSEYAVFGGAWSFSQFTKEKGVSPYGAYNMAGNVWEWVADRYDKNYYSYSDYENPQGPGPESGGLRVVRGGSFRDQAFSIRTTYRYKFDATSQEYSVGFRCAKNATP